MIWGFKLPLVASVLAVLPLSTANHGSLSFSDPGPVSVHENQDSLYVVNIVTANCHITYPDSFEYDCNDYDAETQRCISLNGIYRYDRACIYICRYTASDYGECDSCTVTLSLFKIDGKTVQKRECTDKGCKSCDVNDYCLNAGETYTVEVTCQDYRGYTSDQVSNRFTVVITDNIAPIISFSGGSSIEIRKEDYSEGDTISEIEYTDTDLSVGDDTIEYIEQTSPSPSHIHGNTLFKLDEATGHILVNHNLSLEFSNIYEMKLCVSDRRDEDCETLSITLVACFQTPNCSSNSMAIHDTFGTIHNSPSGLLYTMTTPDPDGHFKLHFRDYWEQLSWKFVSNDLDPETTLDESTGQIHVVNNISIHPAYPTKTFLQVISVSNSDSCYIASCTLTITVSYTNWVIRC